MLKVKGDSCGKWRKIESAEMTMYLLNGWVSTSSGTGGSALQTIPDCRALYLPIRESHPFTQRNGNFGSLNTPLNFLKKKKQTDD